jgi:hypothetical protein
MVVYLQDTTSGADVAAYVMRGANRERIQSEIDIPPPL